MRDVFHETNCTGYSTIRGIPKLQYGTDAKF